MPIRYITSTLLLATAFVAITAAAIDWSFNGLPFSGAPRIVLMVFVQGSAVWLPFVFAAYAIGRREQLTWKFITIFAFAELAAIGLKLWIFSLLSPHK